jgi:hypothetical protein
MEKTVKGTITFKSEVLLREALGILSISKLKLPDSIMRVVVDAKKKSLNIIADYRTHEIPINTVKSMSKAKELSIEIDQDKNWPKR